MPVFVQFGHGKQKGVVWPIQQSAGFWLETVFSTWSAIRVIRATHLIPCDAMDLVCGVIPDR